MLSSVTSPADLQSHLYASFLEAKTPDVTLHVRGQWQAKYRLHRVVLIQAVSLSYLTNVAYTHFHVLGIFSLVIYGWILRIIPETR